MKKVHQFINNLVASIVNVIRASYLYMLKDRMLMIFLTYIFLLHIIVKLSSDMRMFNVRSFLFTLAWYSIFIGFSYCFKTHKGRTIYLLVITCIAFVITLGNIIYFRYYESFLSVSLIKQLSLFAAMPDSDQIGVGLVTVFDIVIVALFIVTLVLYKKMSARAKEVFESISQRKLYRKTYFKMAGIAFFSGILFLQGAQYSQVTKLWNRPIVVENFGLVNYHLVDTVKSISLFIDYELNDVNYQKFLDFFAKKEPVTNEYTNRFKGKNVIVIHAESIEQFLLHREINGMEITPNLNRLANQGYYFNNMYSQESVGTSSDTEFTFSSSLLPVNNGTIFLTHFDRTYQTTQKLLKEAGYYTLSMHGNNGSFWNRDAMHPQLGYDFFFDHYFYEDIEKDNIIGLGISDEAFFERSIEILQDIYNKEGLFYATLITLTNHTPWGDTDKYVVKKATEEGEIEYTFDCGSALEGKQVCQYLQAVHYADYAIGQFIELLKQQDFYEDSIVVIYGDHPANIKQSEMELFYDQLETSPYEKKEFTRIEYKAQQKVPFIIWSDEKNLPDPQVFDQPIGMMDASVILQNMLGVYNEFALGQDYRYDREAWWDQLLAGEIDLEQLNPDDFYVVPFINGDWTDGIVYFDNFRNTFIIRNEHIAKSHITREYLDYQNARAEKVVDMSNLINKYDAIAEHYKRLEENANKTK